MSLATRLTSAGPRPASSPRRPSIREVRLLGQATPPAVDDHALDHHGRSYRVASRDRASDGDPRSYLHLRPSSTTR